MEISDLAPYFLKSQLPNEWKNCINSLAGLVVLQLINSDKKDRYLIEERAFFSKKSIEKISNLNIKIANSEQFEKTLEESYRESLNLLSFAIRKGDNTQEINKILFAEVKALTTRAIEEIELDYQNSDLLNIIPAKNFLEKYIPDVI